MLILEEILLYEQIVIMPVDLPDLLQLALNIKGIVRQDSIWITNHIDR
jgi:hypothetical protein